MKLPEGVPAFATSYQELAQIFGTARTCFPRFRKEHPDAPVPEPNGRHNVRAWFAFFKNHPEIKLKGSGAVVTDPEMARIERETALERLRKLKLSNDKEAAKSIDRADVESFLLELQSHIRRTCRELLVNELPAKLVGKRAEDITVKMMEVEILFLDALRDPSVLNKPEKKPDQDEEER